MWIGTGTEREFGYCYDRAPDYNYLSLRIDLDIFKGCVSENVLLLLRPWKIDIKIYVYKTLTHSYVCT
jgi:hypothetical protein